MHLSGLEGSRGVVMPGMAGGCIETGGEGESWAGGRTWAVRPEHLDFLLKAETVLSGVICSKQMYIFKLRLTLRFFQDIAQLS